jgi:N-acetylglutamate synthase-like GNAT family acetyltransferase
MGQIQIVQADTSRESVVARLRSMQRELLDGSPVLNPRFGYWWIAEVDGVPAGFAALHPSTQWSDVGYMSRSGVMPVYRGMGLQKRLIRVRERKARQQLWRWLVSDTRDNPASANSLIACGFRVFHPSRPWGFADSTYWRKRVLP